MGLLDFISDYYILNSDFTQIRKLIVWICSNFISSDKAHCLALIQSPVFSLIVDSIPNESKTKVIEEILYLIMNILSYNDSEISFSFLNYKLMQSLIDLYSANAQNWNTYMHLFILSVFKSIFKTENNYRLKDNKNYNFDDNDLNFIEYCLRQGFAEFLTGLRNRQNERVNELIDEIENEIKRRF